MCGICGIVSLDGTTRPDAAALARMNAALTHRGPDDEGALVDGPVALAMRRLSIIDLPGGHQPLSNEDGTVHVVLNGEIYNYRELRQRLVARGHTLTTHSDTEVLVHLYEDHGDAFLSELRGMFAIALWDARRRRLLVARDPFGIKPLYWSGAGGSLTFASELRALERHPGFRRDLDFEALDAFLAFNSIPSPLTVYRDARKLNPGHKLVWEGGTPRTERYARPGPVPAGELRREDEAALAAELRERLRDSVRAHLVADVPVGVLLSGGIDSAALAALAATESGGAVSTFSIGFEERSFNELDRARQVAHRYGTDHHELVVRPDAADLLPSVAAAFDEPFADSSALPTWLVSRLAAEHVKVALSGEGGDELFGGYYTYVADLIAPRVGRAAAALRPLVDRIPSSSRRVPLEYKAKRFTRGAALPPLERHHAWKEIFSADARDELLGGRLAGGNADPIDLHRERYAETAGSEPLARLQDVDIGTYLVDDLLTKTDRASMAHSLEARVPFLDPVVAELAYALPTRMKVRGFAKKRLLRRAVAPLIPREIAYGRKRGFSIPAAAWLRGELLPFARDVLSPDRMRRQGVFDAAAVGRVLETHVSRRDDLSRQLWGLIAFSLWYERAGDAAAAAKPPASVDALDRPWGSSPPQRPT